MVYMNIRKKYVSSKAAWKSAFLNETQTDTTASASQNARNRLKKTLKHEDVGDIHIRPMRNTRNVEVAANLLHVCT